MISVMESSIALHAMANFLRLYADGHHADLRLTKSSTTISTRTHIMIYLHLLLLDQASHHAAIQAPVKVASFPVSFRTFCKGYSAAEANLHKGNMETSSLVSDLGSSHQRGSEGQPPEVGLRAAFQAGGRLSGMSEEDAVPSRLEASEGPIWVRSALPAEMITEV